MNKILALLLAASCLTAVGQVEISYPYNPDNGDGAIGSPDLIELLTLYGIDFQPEPPVVNEMPIQEWMDSIQSIVAVQQAFMDSVQVESGTTDLDACDNMESINYHGYDYELVAIGEQCWFAENLRTTHYTNGDEISNSIYSWIGSQSLLGEYQDQGSTGVFGEMVDSSVFVASPCEVDLLEGMIGSCNGETTNLVSNSCDASESVAAYGRLYNGYAVMDARGICPSGWHVSNDADWLELEVLSGMLPTTALQTGSRGNVAHTLKSTDGWGALVDGLNTIGFSALPGGLREFDVNGIVSCPLYFVVDTLGNVVILGGESISEVSIQDDLGGSKGCWWSPHGSSFVCREMDLLSFGITRGLGLPNEGYSVRCIKDPE